MMVKYNQADLELPEQATAKDLAEKENLRDPSQALAAVNQRRNQGSSYTTL